MTRLSAPAEPRRTTTKAQKAWRELEKAANGKKPSKYRAVRCEVDGEKFDSKKEANLWRVLKVREKLGGIDCLCRQVIYPLEVNGVLVARYVADFTWWEKKPNERGQFVVVADAKGFKTPVYRLKKKLMKAIHGIDIREL